MTVKYFFDNMYSFMKFKMTVSLTSWHHKERSLVDLPSESFSFFTAVGVAKKIVILDSFSLPQLQNGLRVPSKSCLS